MHDSIGLHAQSPRSHRLDRNSSEHRQKSHRTMDEVNDEFLETHGNNVSVNGGKGNSSNLSRLSYFRNIEWPSKDI